MPMVKILTPSTKTPITIMSTESSTIKSTSTTEGINLNETNTQIINPEIHHPEKEQLLKTWHLIMLCIGSIFLIISIVLSVYCFKRFKRKKFERAPLPPPRPLFTINKELSLSSVHTSNWSASYFTPEVISCDNSIDSQDAINVDIIQLYSTPKTPLEIVQEEFKEELVDSCESSNSSSLMNSMEVACSNFSQCDSCDSINS